MPTICRRHPIFKRNCGGKLGIGENIRIVQEIFGKIFNEGTEFQRDGSQFDRLFKDGDTYRIGGMKAFTMHTPGHTPACMTHVIGNAAFVGDTLFMPDGGTARADFPGGDAHQLYRSIKKVLSLPREMRLFMCHDYAPGGREIRWETTVGEERRNNVHVRDGVSEESLCRTCAMPATRPWACRSSSFHRSRSIFGADSCRRRMKAASASSKCR